MKKNIFALSLTVVALTVSVAPVYCAPKNMQPLPKKPVPQHERKIINNNVIYNFSNGISRTGNFLIADE